MLTYGCNGDLRVALADYISWSLKKPRKRGELATNAHVKDTERMNLV